MMILSAGSLCKSGNNVELSAISQSMDTAFKLLKLMVLLNHSCGGMGSSTLFFLHNSPISSAVTAEMNLRSGDVFSIYSITTPGSETGSDDNHSKVHVSNSTNYERSPQLSLSNGDWMSPCIFTVNSLITRLILPVWSDMTETSLTTGTPFLQI